MEGVLSKRSSKSLVVGTGTKGGFCPEQDAI